MSYSFVQQASAYSAGASSLTAGTFTPNAGDLLPIAFFMNPTADLLNISISDGGAGNNYVSPGIISTNNTSIPITFSAPPTGTSQGLNANFTGASGTYLIVFSDGELRIGTLANGASTCSWAGGTSNLFAGALTGSPTVNATAYSTSSGQILVNLYAQNAAGVSTTIALADSSGNHLEGLYVGDYSGIATSGAYLGGASGFLNIPSVIGANEITTGNVSGVTQPSLLWGFCRNQAADGTPLAGTSPTSFTGRGNVWVATSAQAEDATVSSNVAVTFGTNSSSQYGTFYSGAMAFNLAATQVPFMNYSMPPMMAQ